METLVFPLAAFLLVAAVASGIYLYVRLQRKEARKSGPRSIKAPGDRLSVEPAAAAIDQYLYDRCCKYMVERHPFLVDGYTLQDLANALFTNRVYLSKTINRYSGKNFRSYVNYYRVMYAVDIFHRNPSLRVIELAQLSGFHTNTSFYQAFKAVMGESPSMWCSRVRKHTLKHPVKH